MNLKIQDVYPAKAQFLKNQPVEIRIELENPTGEALDGNLIVEIMELNHTVERLNLSVSLGGGEHDTRTLLLGSFDEEFKGYGVDVHLQVHEQRIQTLSTSFDVVSNWRKSPRYGFLADYDTAELGDTTDVQHLAKFHINLVQFYDWMYKHDQLVSPEVEYVDLMGRHLNLNVVQEKIEACHEYGMKCIAYGAVYAASRTFYEQHPDWALYDSNGKVLDLIDRFFIMNIAEHSPWHAHIIAEYEKAIQQLDFDGIHMDTYGFPKTAMAKLDAQPSVVRLEHQFPTLIHNTRKRLTESKSDVVLILNNVGNWPVDTVALADQDVMYIEVWHPYERYHHLQQIIERAKGASQGKPVILAAYMRPFKEADETFAQQTETSTLMLEQAQNAALLTTAVITACGGYHLLLGEKNGLLTQAYYVDYSVASEAFMRRMRSFYDVMIRYAHLLYDPELRDVSMTHMGGDNLEYTFGELNYSSYGEPDKVWVIAREKPGLKVIHWINLVGNEDDRWNEGKHAPTEVKDIEVRIQIEEPLSNLFLVSPDQAMGRAQTVEYELVAGPRGQQIVARIPCLQLWSTLFVELG